MPQLPGLPASAALSMSSPGADLPLTLQGSDMEMMEQISNDLVRFAGSHHTQSLSSMALTLERRSCSDLEMMEQISKELLKTDVRLQLICLKGNVMTKGTGNAHFATWR